MPDGLKAVIFRFDISIFLWYLYKMVAQNILRTFEEKEVCSETNFGFDGSFDVTKCHQQIEIPELFNMCAPC